VFSDVHLQSFGPFSDFRWSEHGRVNVVVGENDTGKSYLLRALYAIAKSVELVATRKGEHADAERVLMDKLRWTFQWSPDVGALVRKGAATSRIEARFAGRDHVFEILVNGPPNLCNVAFHPQVGAATNVVFLPPKEVLTIFAAIAVSRDIHQIYGFDDTYNDLVKLLRIPPTQGDVSPELSRIITDLEAFYGGQIVKKGITDEFVFVRGDASYGMPATADGIKKLGILAALLKSRSIDKESIVFVDEPETNLHPRAISVLTTLLFRLGQAGVQVYLATHSYFVLKQLEILAKQHHESVPFCSLLRRGEDIEARFADLREGMPDNPIIDESLRLYDLGIDVDFKLARG
jgi:energy-coupling factor transporter ATP-binding protein EcfA2